MNVRPLILAVRILTCAVVAVLVLLMSPSPMARADAAPPLPPPDDVGQLQVRQFQTPQLAYYHDRTGALSVADVASQPMAANFQVADQAIPNLGMREGAVWVRLALTNSQEVTQSVIVDLDLPLADQIELFAAPDVAPIYATGASRPYATRAIPGSAFAFPLQVAPGVTTEWFMRIAVDAPVRLHMTLANPDAYEANLAASNTVVGIVLGTLLLMSAYNLLVFLVLREPKQLLLAFFGFAVVVSSGLVTGYVARWQDPLLAFKSIDVLAVAVAAVVGAFVLLSISFLELRQRQRIAYWLLMGALGVVGAAGIAALAGYGQASFTLIIAILPPVLIIIFVTTLVVLRQGLRMAVFLLIAQLVPIFFGIFQSISLLGVGPWFPSNRLAVPANNLLLMLLMSLALADRVNVLRQEANRANAALAASRQQLADYLDALPFSVQVHNAELKPIYLNAEIRRTAPDLPPGWDEQDYSEWLRDVPVYVSGTDEPYPVDNLPLIRAAHGDAAHADDLTVDFGGRQIPMEAWSVPLRNEQGKVAAIITAFQNISERRAIEQELASYRDHLEQRVAQRTAELAAVNASLGARVAELSAINDISRSMAFISDLELTLQDVVNILCDLYAVPNASISLFDAQRSALHVVAMKDRGAIALHSYVDRLLPIVPGADQDYLRQSPLVIQNIDQVQSLPADIRADLRAHGVAQVLVAALLARDEHLGVIALVTDDPARRFTVDELRVAQTVAGQVAAAIDVARLIDEARRQRDVAEALRKTTSALNRSLDQEIVLTTILQQLHQVLDYEGAAIALLAGKELEIVGAEGLSEPHLGARVPVADAPGSGVAASPMRQVFHRGEPLLLSDTRHAPDWGAWPDAAAFRSWLGVPLVAGGKAIGVLYLVSTLPGAFVQEHADLLMTFADQAVLAVTNARLYQQAQVAAASSERERIARDLHDAVTQSLFSASLVATALPLQIKDIPPAALADVELLQTLTRGALAEMRTLLLELRPEHLVEAKLEVLLAQLADAFTGRMGVPVQLSANADPAYRPPADVKVVFYRVAQEALNNIAKHARATQVTINCSIRQDALRLTVLDDGCGFDLQSVRPERLGISIMRERTTEVGAHFAVDSEPGRGTHVFLTWSPP